MRAAVLALVMIACAAFAAPAVAQEQLGLDVHVRIEGMHEEYARDRGPLDFVVSRLRLDYVLAASGRGMLGGQRLAYPRQSIDQPFTAGREPRGFQIDRDAEGGPLLRIWAEGLPREALVRARFVKGDWQGLRAGRAVALAAPVRELERIHGVGEQLGRAVTNGLRQRLEGLVPFMSIRVGELRQTGLRVWKDDVIIEGSGGALRVIYPTAEASYDAPVSVGR